MSLGESAGIDHQYNMPTYAEGSDSIDQISTVTKHVLNSSNESNHEDKYTKVHSNSLNCSSMNQQHHWLEGMNFKSKQLVISNGGNTLINRDNVLLPTQHSGLTSLDKQKINDACKDVSWL